MHLKKILVPIDFSAHSLRALQIAKQLAADSGAMLNLLHIWQPQVAFTQNSLPAVVLAAQEEAARVRLEALHADHASRKVHSHLSSGGPVDEIVRFAEAHSIDLIVMGIYGRSGVKHWAAGSVAEAVLRRAACPVLTCKLPRQVGLNQDECSCAEAGAHRSQPTGSDPQSS